ncbi:MAG: cytidine deaminase [Candidatus Cloacimonadota bacterium]|nr:cytidine deaminase [Candidatus Cloacimonadota bacterium]
MGKEKLLQEAKKSADNAYAPYSGFKVGAAILTQSGKIYSGCNVENASYGLTNCAERTAIFKAVSEGERKFKHLLIYVDSDKLFTPCGACRQVINEFTHDIPITVVSNKQSKTFSIKELLPHSFDL